MNHNGSSLWDEVNLPDADLLSTIYHRCCILTVSQPTYLIGVTIGANSLTSSRPLDRVALLTGCFVHEMNTSHQISF